MLSVIIPTMWKYAPFLDYLEGVLEQNSVGEVIIINNNVYATPDSEVLAHEKIRMHNCKKIFLLHQHGILEPKWLVMINFVFCQMILMLI